MVNPSPRCSTGGPAATSLSGWNLEWIKKAEARTNKDIFPEGLREVINFNPFSFPEKGEDEFIEALVGALDKVPMSDFEGILDGDAGLCRMGIKDGEPFEDNIDDYVYKYDGATNSLVERKYPSSEYITKIRDFRDYVGVFEQYNHECEKYFNRENKTKKEMNLFEEILYCSKISLVVDLEELETCASEDNYNKLRDKYTNEEAYTILEKALEKEKGISSLVEGIVLENSSFFQLYDEEKEVHIPYEMPDNDKTKAVHIIEKGLREILAPNIDVDPVLQLSYFERLIKLSILHRLKDFFKIFYLNRVIFDSYYR